MSLLSICIIFKEDKLHLGIDISNEFDVSALDLYYLCISFLYESMECQTYTLPNGLRIIHQPTSSAVAYCGFTVNAGTRDEADNEWGLAHFVEHTIFKGTSHRKAWHILNRMETVGGELNAYTSKEETVVYSIFPGGYLSRAMELLSDLISDSQFPERELEKERVVIVDEINSYRDNPSELVYDEFENLLFAGHDLGHNILGTEDTLAGISSNQAKRFLHAVYVPENMTFFSMGSTPFGRLIRMAEHYFGSWSSPLCRRERVRPGAVVPFMERRKYDTFQTHAIIGARAYDLFDEKRRTLVLMNNLLGGPGMNSRLNVALRERRGYVYNVESAVTSYTDTGVFSVYFGCDPIHADRCVDLVMDELKRLRTQALTSSQLYAAKKQFIGQIGVSSDNHENTALGMGKSFLHYNKYDSLAEVARSIEKITAADILETANELLPDSALCTLILE